MFKTKKRRTITAIVGGVLTYIFGFATAAFWVGVAGIGYGWPAFWAVAAIASGVVIFALVATFIVTVVVYWISKGE